MGSHAYLYVDGACSFNGTPNARAGIGVFWGDNHPYNISEPLRARQTNNCAEIYAALRGINQAAKYGFDYVTIYTDSQFLFNSVKYWRYKWQNNGWKTCDGRTVKNKHDFLKLFEAMRRINTNFVKVKAHSGNYGNEQADWLAKSSLSDSDDESECDNENSECDDEDSECYDEDSECDDEDSECDDEDSECYDEDSECDDEDSECYDEDSECCDEESECDDEDSECYDEDSECCDEESDYYDERPQYTNRGYYY